KQLAGHYPPMQVAALRGAVGLPLVVAWAAVTTGLAPLLRVHWPLHLLRGVLGVLFLSCFVAGLSALPMSTAYAITFVGPLLVTAMAVPLLREHVGPRRWSAIAVGIIGVLVVLRPGGEGAPSRAGQAQLNPTVRLAA
ncbi:DMT family transporter, partial [Acinetobacter baumannii]|uniref:DMT family transporter n=1 Tax=Acinetobacter baumannii TaxID=470 RepID=UPI001896EBE0